jgi:hypothetical protein
LSTPRSAGGLWAFFRDYLSLSHPAHPDQPEEARRFIEEALWQGDGSLQTLLTAGYTFVDSALAMLYWSDPSVADTWQKVSPPDGRAGALTLGGVLSSATNRSARGRFVREHFLCSAPIVLPSNVPSLEQATDDFVAENGRQPTRRELLAMHTSRPGCASCHALIDPLGQPFEGFGVNGAARTLDAGGEPVVTSSVITGTLDLNGPVTGALELEQKLAASAEVQRCFVQRLYSYAYGFQAAEADACYVDQLTERFVASHGNIRALVADIVVAESFGERSAMKP